MNRITLIAATTAAFVSLAEVRAIDVVDGQTNVLLDTELLASAAMLDLSGVSDDVIVPGEVLGEGTVAFGINPRDEGMAPTTFSYEAGLASFSGTIEHIGSVFFNDDVVEVGDFSIGYDVGRVSDATGASGFFVESTTGIAAILFDLEITTPDPVASTSQLQVYGELLVSPEFAAFLLDQGLAAADLTGADVGDAFV
ncbi:MAG: hypothetical protein AAF961_10565, partial [Planctomycetota bacterium]